MGNRKINTQPTAGNAEQAQPDLASQVLKNPAPAGTKITFGAGRKVSDGNYGSYDFHCSISLEANGTETPEEIVKKGIAFTEAVLGAKVKSATAKRLAY